MMSLQRLDWDSDFFGFGVGRVGGPFESAPKLAAALQAAAESGFRLVYGACDHKDDASHHIALAVGGRFVDAKRTYAMDLTRIQPTPVFAEEAPDDVCSLRQLRRLAWQAAEYSRFRVDPALPTGSWRRMYSQWMQNSIKGELADVVLVERADGRIAGMITVSCQDECGRIGLLAVDSKWRGYGLGRHLLDAAVQRCRAKGCSKLEVVTQGNNVAACSSYERAGFQVINEQDVFHFWID